VLLERRCDALDLDYVDAELCRALRNGRRHHVVTLPVAARLALCGRSPERVLLDGY
jgi:hypothetical protein